MAELTETDARYLRELQTRVVRGQQARVERDQRLAAHRRNGVPVTHLAEAVELSRGHVHEILRKEGVRPGDVPPGGDTKHPEPAPPYRVLAGLRALGFDTSASPEQLGTAVRERLASAPPAP